MSEWENLPWHGQYEAACVTVVRGLDIDDVAGLWFDRPLTPLPDAEAAQDWQDYYSQLGDVRGYLAVGVLEPGVIFIWESEGGFEASRPEVLTALSAQGSACVNYWNDVNCTPTFGYAVGGQIGRLFTTDDPSMSYGVGVDAPLPEEAPLPWPPPDEEFNEEDPEVDGRASALQLQAQLMRVPQADPAWMELEGVRWFGTPFYRDAMPRPGT